MKNLNKRKKLASKVLGVGKGRIKFDEVRLEEIKEAITKQDIRELYKEGIIMIKPIKGRRKVKKRKTKRSYGKIKMKLRKRKQRYVKLVRKLRRILKILKVKKMIGQKTYLDLRKKIKAKTFKSTANFKEYLKEISRSSK